MEIEVKNPTPCTPQDPDASVMECKRRTLRALHMPIDCTDFNL
jgi:hypothetical protein